MWRERVGTRHHPAPPGSSPASKPRRQKSSQVKPGRGSDRVERQRRTNELVWGHHSCNGQPICFWHTTDPSGKEGSQSKDTHLTAHHSRRKEAKADSNCHSTNATATSSGSVVPSATATATATTSSSIVCPYANRTVYNLEDQSDKSFLVLCGRDYNSCCGAVDMLTVNTTSFEDCLEHCGKQEGCAAVGWGNYYGVNTCWLKSAYGEPNWSGSWYAAILQ